MLKSGWEYGILEVSLQYTQEFFQITAIPRNAILSGSTFTM